MSFEERIIREVNEMGQARDVYTRKLEELKGVCQKCGLPPDLCVCSLIEAENHRTERISANLPEWFRKTLKDRAVRLLMMRAGGRYRLFEAGMLYHCLVLLGMHEFTTLKEVDELEKVTCHFLRESGAQKYLERLLKNKPNQRKLLDVK